MDKHTFSYEHNGSIVTWDVRDIWKAVKDIKAVNIPLSNLNHFGKEVYKEYDKEDIERIDQADLAYPLIVSGQTYFNPKIIVDGYHRLFKARKLKLKTIQVKLIKKMPKPLYCEGKPFEIEGLDFDWYDHRKK